MRSVAVYEPPYTGDAHPDPELGRQLKSGPCWARMQALAHTLSADLRLANDGQVPLERFMRIPVIAAVLARFFASS